MSAPSPDTPRELVLVGGGHAHVEVLKRWAEQPVPGVRVTLVGDVDQAPYSGMLPGLVAGLYRPEEAHLDLPGLAAATGARWLRASARGVDPVARHLLLQDQDPLPYDVLSLNIGGTPALADLPGATAHALPVKPVAGFLAGWERALAEAGMPRPSSFRVVIVGGGAGGVELALSMVRRWRKVAATRPGPAPPLRCALVSASASVPAGHPRGVQRHLTAALEQEGVELHLGERVASVDPQWVHAESGLQWAYDLLVWATHVAPAGWVRTSGLAVTDDGFLRVNEFLQSVSHPEVFGAGDVATMDRHARPKSGVFAVRQGPPLAENLRRAVTGLPLVPYRPQRAFLSLIGLGRREAVASRNGLAARGRWVWRWKEWIDRRWMRRYQRLIRRRSHG